MLKVVEDETAVNRLVRRFINQLRKLPHKKKTITVGHRGRSYEVRAIWLESLGIWMAPDWRGAYYRHIFGIITPSPVPKLSVTCEINFPRTGIDRKVGGAFAIDTKGRTYVVHRGLLGGKKGMGKGLFIKKYRGTWAEMEEREKVSPVVVVGDLASVRFPRQVAKFLRQVAEIKEVEEKEDLRQLSMPLDLSFVPEISGWESFGETKHDLSSACDLSLAVEDLGHTLMTRGVRVKSLGPNCLYLQGEDEEKDVYFCILPDTQSRSIREGAIHLFFLALRSRRPCRLVLVIPEAINEFLGERLKEFSIETIVYQWKGDKASFVGLDS